MSVPRYISYKYISVPNDKYLRYADTSTFIELYQNDDKKTSPSIKS